MQLSGCMFQILQILQLFAIIKVTTSERVRIHGLLACGGIPVLGARLKLYDATGFKDDGTMANHWDEFLFQMKDIDASKLYITIDHHCDGGILHKQCMRKDKLIFQQIAQKPLIYHIGMIELQNITLLHPKIWQKFISVKMFIRNKHVKGYRRVKGYLQTFKGCGFFF
uniref:Uncharacterized protein n=1 Tax=Wuchereria bancrofti TaxID=6293 RepID=A0A1I8EH27_WUCBA